MIEGLKNMFNSQPSTVLDEVFDPARGWTFPPTQIPLQRSIASDGSPYYIAKVDDIEMEVFEQTRWKEGISRSVPAGRLVALTTFTGVTLTNPAALLNAAFDTRGLPSFGVDKQGRITLQAAFPYAKGFPVDIARKQLMVCMGIVAEEARELLQAWNKNTASGKSVDWDTARGVASVAGALLRAFVGF